MIRRAIEREIRRRNGRFLTIVYKNQEGFDLPSLISAATKTGCKGINRWTRR
jgi:hypothetical protein